MSAVHPDFAGRVAVITGGGRGFGKAFGRALAADGARVVLLDIDADAAQAAAADIGKPAQAFACDVTDEAQVAAVIARITEMHGGIDFLINNAGLHSAIYNRPMIDMGVATLRRLFDVNVLGVIICSLAVQSAMRGRDGAAIVNISSSAAYASATAYGASKLAVQGLTMAMAREFAADGIRVNGIAPGLIFTDTIRAELPEAMVEAVLKMQILSRRGEEDDIVEAMRYLVSARSAFITGETLRVSGGHSLSV
ncbi:MAG: hypothetical protein RLZZ136_496 [Pseudomonadota bacterium]